jgi:ubiquitin
MSSVPFPACLAIATALVFITEESNILFSTIYYGALIFVAYFFVEPEADEVDYDDNHFQQTPEESVEKPTQAIEEPKDAALQGDAEEEAKLKQLEEARLQIEAEQFARLQAEEKVRANAQALEAARLQAAEEEKRKAIARLRATQAIEEPKDAALQGDAEEEAKLKQLEEARLQIESEQSARLQAEEKVRANAQALEAARLQAAEEEKRKAIARLRAETEEEARLKKAYWFNGYQGNVGYLTSTPDEANAKENMRVRISNEATNRSRDLLVPISSDLTLAEAIYENDAVRAANIRKWPKDLAQEVKQKTSEIQCLLLDPNSSNPIHTFSVTEMESKTTATLHELASKTNEIIKMLLKCEKFEAKSSGSDQDVEHVDADGTVHDLEDLNEIPSSLDPPSPAVSNVPTAVGTPSDQTPAETPVAEIEEESTEASEEENVAPAYQEKTVIDATGEEYEHDKGDVAMNEEEDVGMSPKTEVTSSVNEEAVDDAVLDSKDTSADSIKEFESTADHGEAEDTSPQLKEGSKDAAVADTQNAADVERYQDDEPSPQAGDATTDADQEQSDEALPQTESATDKSEEEGAHAMSDQEAKPQEEMLAALDEIEQDFDVNVSQDLLSPSSEAPDVGRPLSEVESSVEGEAEDNSAIGEMTVIKGPQSILPDENVPATPDEPSTQEKDETITQPEVEDEEGENIKPAGSGEALQEDGSQNSISVDSCSSFKSLSIADKRRKKRELEAFRLSITTSPAATNNPSVDASSTTTSDNSTSRAARPGVFLGRFFGGQRDQQEK